jgi:uncharacterized membrane protein
MNGAADLEGPPIIRYWELDLLRGVAVTMMIGFHALYDLDYLSGPGLVDVHSGIWRAFALATASIFLLLVGISLTISSARARIRGEENFGRYLRRGGVIFSWGGVITVSTILLLEEGYILFGVLHLIGASIILSPPFTRRPYRALLGGSAAVSAGIFLRQISIDTPWLLWIGLAPRGFYSLDYFPLAPWFGVVLLGISLGGFLYPDGERRFHLPDLSFRTPAKELSILGRNSLAIYLLHQPALIISMEILGVIDLSERITFNIP